MKIRNSVLAAVVPTCAAAAIQWAAWDLVSPHACLLFYPTVFFVALFAGPAAGIVATLLAALMCWIVFLPLAAPGAILLPVLILTVTGISFSLLSLRLRQLTSRRARDESDARLSQALDHAADAIFIVRPDGHCVYANESATALLGYSRDEMLTMGFQDLTFADEQGRAVECFETLRNAGRYQGECRLRRRDGSQVPVDINAHTMPDGTYFGSCRDISALQESREALAQSERRYRTAFETSLDAVNITTLAEGRFLEANRAFLKGTGLKREEVIGRTGLELGLWTNTSDRDRLYEALRRDGVCRNLETQFRAKDGSTRWALMSATLTYLNGEPCVLSVTRDITVLKQSQDALRESEERYRATFETTQDAVIIACMPDGRIIDVNPAFVKASGYAREEAQGHTATELGLWVDLKDKERLYEALERDGVCLGLEAHFRSKHGETGCWLVSGKFVELQGRRCLLTLSRDITEAKATREALDRSHQELEDQVKARTADLVAANARLSDTAFAMEAAGIGIHWVDARSSRFLYVNRFAAEMLGYQVDEMLRLKVSDIAPAAPQDDFYVLTEAMRQKGHAKFDADLMTKSGKAVPCGITIHYLAGAGPETSKFIAFITDITHRKEAERALVEAKEAAESANIAKSAFLANMSHEIRTPLNAITGMAHLIRRAGVSAEQDERLHKIEIAGKHLTETIDAILDLSKIEAGRFVLEETAVDLDRLFANVVSMLDERARTRHNRLLVEAPLLRHGLMGDPTRLQQALINYVGNAIKFTQDGTIVIRAFVESETADSATLRFEVEDTGIGIEVEALGRLFGAFEQADNTTTRKYGGSGLGLAITRRIAVLMHGDAGVITAPGEGSTFWFTARLRKESTAASTGAEAPAESAEGRIRRRHTGALVLVAEDEPVNREIAQIMLEEAGLRVHLAVDGADAVDLASRNDYALILMDMQMPRLNGLDATRRIRELPGRATVPIVAMTANAYAEDRARCMEAGMNDFISKPVVPDDFYETLLKWLEKRG